MSSSDWGRLSNKLTFEDLAHRTRLLLRSEKPWRTISSLPNEVVQRVVDVIQTDLDAVSYGPSDCYRSSCLKCLRTLTKEHNVLPASFFCHDVSKVDQNPISGGGFADIWRGTLRHKVVCLKVLRMFITGPRREDILKECYHEALVWRQLQHPNILPFLGINETSFAPSFCLISPWMVNGDIISFLETHPHHDRLCSVTEVARGMQYLHELDPQIIHADIRGFNILVTDEFHCCLADFGLSLMAVSQAPSDSTKALRGTLRWLPPEVLNHSLSDENRMSARDIYSFGCTVIEIFTGKPPFSHIKHDAGIIYEVVTARQKPVRPSSPSIPDAVWMLVSECLNFDPSTRPTALAIASLLESLKRPPSTALRPTSRPPSVCELVREPPIRRGSPSRRRMNNSPIHLRPSNIPRIRSPPIPMLRNPYMDVIRPTSRREVSRSVSSIGVRRRTDSSAPSRPSSAAPRPALLQRIWTGPVNGTTYLHVYTAVDAETGQTMIVKRARLPSGNDRTRMLENLQLKFASVEDLRHPNIAQFLGFEQLNDLISIFMEYVPGTTLHALLTKHRRFGDTNVTRFFLRNIVNGLTCLHDRGIMNCNLKADNILVSTSGVCKISGFGVPNARAFTPINGTIFGVAPEAINPREEGYGVEVDIWSLGCIATELWIGLDPWQGVDLKEAILALFDKQVLQLPPTLSLSYEAEDFYGWCLRLNPTLRAPAPNLLRHGYLTTSAGWQFPGFRDAARNDFSMKL